MRQEIRFNNYRTIMAKFASRCRCGTEIKPGDRIAYAGKGAPVLCASCYDRWEVENADADMYESAY